MDHGHSREYWALSRTVLTGLQLCLRSLIRHRPIDRPAMACMARRRIEAESNTIWVCEQRAGETREGTLILTVQSVDGSVNILMVCNEARFWRTICPDDQ
jgi:hypothetical protein